MKNFIVFGNWIKNTENSQQYALENDFLLEALSDESKLKFIEKYKWIYFTWDKSIDEQIISAILSLKQQIKDSWEKIWIDKDKTGKTKLEKLLFILKNTIEKKYSPILESRINIAKNCKTHLKKILLTAVDKYQDEELDMLYSFHCVTFDVLERLNWFNDNQWSQTKQIMNLLRDDFWINIFPNSISKDNLENIIKNILYLKGNNFDNIEVFTNNEFNAVFLANWRLSVIELLSLPCEDFKLVISTIWSDLDCLTATFPGYEAYQYVCDELRMRHLTNDKMYDILSGLTWPKNIKLLPFWIDKWLPLDMLSSPNIDNSISYEQCEYIYDNMSQNPNILLKLFEFKYDTLIFIYNNITNDVDEIINDYAHLKYIKCSDMNVIYENVKKLEWVNSDKTFQNLIKIMGNKKYYKKVYWNIIFFSKYFTDALLNRLDKDSLEDRNWMSLIFKSCLKNLEFFFNNWIFTSFDDFLNKDNLFLLYMNIGQLNFLHDYWLCKSKEDFRLAWWTLCSLSHENAKYFYDEGIYTTLDDLISENNTILLMLELTSIKFLHENKICITIEDFIKYQHIIQFADDESLSILSDLYQKNIDYEDKFDLFNHIFQKEYSNKLKNEIIHKIWHLPIGTAKKYSKLCEIFNNSYSSDVQAVKDYLIIDILDTDNPEEVVKKVNTIFMESDLPIVSKIFQVFKYVYTENIFNKKLEQHKNASHYLQSCDTYGKRLSIIYKDLMHIMIKSGESSLKEFIQSIICSRKALYDFENSESLNYEWYKQILSLLKTTVALSTINNNLVKNAKILKPDWNIDTEAIKELYKNLKRSLLIKENDSLYNFFLKLCRKIWYNSLEDIITDMEESQKKANDNWISMFISTQEWEAFNSSNTYFLKWVELEPFWEILNRWVTSKEYLWWWEWSDNTVSSDSTPFDTDGVIVNCKDIFQAVRWLWWHGNLAIVINTNKPWIHDTDTGLQWYDSEIYELFKNHGNDCNCYWIRTWIASTEFDAVIYNASEINLDEIQKIKYFIAKKWFYIPVFNLDGNLLFTPQEYSELRQGFSFSDKYQWYDILQRDWNCVSSSQCDKINKWDEKFNDFILEQRNLNISNRNTNNETMAKFVFDKIKGILRDELWIPCNQDKSLLWAELYDSGSTWRWTEIPSNDIDLDFTLLLNSEDFEKLDTIQNVIHKKIWTLESSDHSTVDGNWLQIKSNINGLWKDFGYEKWIRFDLLILKKTKSYLYPSNVAMQDRLSKLEQLYWKDTLDFVKENVVIMKKLLKSQWRYKNTEWWMGWIGVENRIMQHHWNFIEALEAFEEAAYGWKYKEGKLNIPFDEFKTRYSIWDCWQNFKDNNNDNYVLKMNESWYDWILNIIKTYRTEWLNWISKLLHDYEDAKAKFLM